MFLEGGALQTIRHSDVGGETEGDPVTLGL